MLKSVLMIGQFPEPMTGEAQCNLIVESTLEEAGFFVKRLNSKIASNVNDVGKFSLYKLIAAVLVIIKSIFHLFKADIVYITPGQTLFGVMRFAPIILFSKLLGKKTILHWHGYGVYHLVSKRKFVGDFLFSEKLTNVFLTQDLVDKIRLKGFELLNFKVVRNFALAQSHALSPIEDSRKETKLKVLFLGGLMDEKGINLFIESAKRFNHRFEFIVCGSGNEQIVNKLSLLEHQGILKYQGSVSGTLKNEVFKSSDIFVLQTSHPTEGVPLTILEAMHHGCAIVSTIHNGIPETLDDAGIYVDKLCSHDLDKKLNILGQDREMLMRYKLLSFERSKAFSLDEFRKNIISLLA